MSELFLSLTGLWIRNLLCCYHSLHELFPFFDLSWMREHTDAFAHRCSIAHSFRYWLLPKAWNVFIIKRSSNVRTLRIKPQTASTMCSSFPYTQRLDSATAGLPWLENVPAKPVTFSWSFHRSRCHFHCILNVYPLPRRRHLCQNCALCFVLSHLSDIRFNFWSFPYSLGINVFCPHPTSGWPHPTVFSLTRLVFFSTSQRRHLARLILLFTCYQPVLCFSERSIIARQA